MPVMCASHSALEEKLQKTDHHFRQPYSKLQKPPTFETRTHRFCQGRWLCNGVLPDGGQGAQFWNPGMVDEIIVLVGLFQGSVYPLGLILELERVASPGFWSLDQRLRMLQDQNTWQAILEITGRVTWGGSVGLFRNWQRQVGSLDQQHPYTGPFAIYSTHHKPLKNLLGTRHNVDANATLHVHWYFHSNALTLRRAICSPKSLDSRFSSDW